MLEAIVNCKVYVRDDSSKTTVCAATPVWKFLIAVIIKMILLLM